MEAREDRIEEILDRPEENIFRRYPEERGREDDYRQAIDEYVIEVWQITTIHYEGFVRDEFMESEAINGIDELEEWIQKYEAWRLGYGDPIDPERVLFTWDKTGEGPESFPFDELVYAVDQLTDLQVEKAQEAENQIDSIVIDISSLDPDRDLSVPGLRIEVLADLARIWLPDWFERRKLAFLSLVGEVENNVNVLEKLQYGEYKTAREARKGVLLENLFEQRTKEFSSKIREPLSRTTLRDIVTNMEFVLEWGRSRANRGLGLDTPVDLRVLPPEILFSIQRMVRGLGDDFTGIAPTPTRATYFDGLMKEIHERIKNMAKENVFVIKHLDRLFFTEFANRDFIRRYGWETLGRVEKDVTNTKNLLDLVQEQPDGASSRQILDELKPHIDHIREMLVRDIEWLLNARNVQEFIHQIFDYSIDEMKRYFPYWAKLLDGKLDEGRAFDNEEAIVDVQDSFGPVHSEDYLKKEIKKAVQRLAAAQDWVLTLVLRIERIVDERDPTDVPPVKKKTRTYATARARRRRDRVLKPVTSRRKNIEAVDFDYVF
jgi:hypothetical protein